MMENEVSRLEDVLEPSDTVQNKDDYVVVHVDENTQPAMFSDELIDSVLREDSARGMQTCVAHVDELGYFDPEKETPYAGVEIPAELKPSITVSVSPGSPLSPPAAVMAGVGGQQKKYENWLRKQMADSLSRCGGDASNSIKHQAKARAFIRLLTDLAELHHTRESVIYRLKFKHPYKNLDVPAAVHGFVEENKALLKAIAVYFKSPAEIIPDQKNASEHSEAVDALEKTGKPSTEWLDGKPYDAEAAKQHVQTLMDQDQ